MSRRLSLRALLASACLSVVVVAAAGCGGDNEGGSQSSTSSNGGADTINVGVATALSGWLAEFDDSFLKSLKLRAEQINDAGGLDGKYKIKLNILDGKSDPAQGAIAAQQLTDSDLMFGPCDQDVGLPAAQVAAKNQIPFITSCAGSSTYPEIVKDYVYLSVPGNWADGSAMAEWGLDKGYKTAYLLYSKDIAYLQGLGEAFKVRYTKGGGKILGTSIYKMGQPRYTTEIDKIANLNPKPDFIAGVVITPDSIVMLKELADRGIDIPVALPYGNQTSLILQPKDALTAIDAYVLGLSPVPEKGSAVAKYFDEYKARYGEDPSPTQAALAVDDWAVVEDAVKRAGSIDHDKIQAALQETENVKGLTGSVTYKGQTGRPKKDFTVVKATPSGFEFQETFFPDEVSRP